jgi:hypothetical protein
MHAAFFKTSFGFWFKNLLSQKHALLQMSLMHLYMRRFCPQGDYGQSHHVFNKSQCKYA